MENEMTLRARIEAIKQEGQLTAMRHDDFLFAVVDELMDWAEAIERRLDGTPAAPPPSSPPERREGSGEVT